MSNSLSVLSALEANRLSSDVAYICLIHLAVVDQATGAVVANRYVARSAEDVTYQGNVYSKGWFDVQMKQEAGKFAEVSLSVQDMEQTVQSLMEANSGLIGSKVTLTVVSETNLLGQPEVVEEFEVIAADSSEYVASFTLGAENSLAQVFPRRRQRKDFCQWRYKSAPCGYSGAMPTCDLSLQGPNGCAAHSNTINFGAFPGINSNGFRYR